MKKIKFPKGIHAIHVPFHPEIGSYEQLYKQVSALDYPKSVKKVTAKIEINYIPHEKIEWQCAEVILEK
jgi:hypothetical protein